MGKHSFCSLDNKSGEPVLGLTPPTGGKYLHDQADNKVMFPSWIG